MRTLKTMPTNRATRSHCGPKPIPIWVQNVSPFSFVVTTFRHWSRAKIVAVQPTEFNAVYLNSSAEASSTSSSLEHLEQTNWSKCYFCEKCTSSRTKNVIWFLPSKKRRRKKISVCKPFHFARGQAHACLISRTHRQYIRLSTCFILRFSWQKKESGECKKKEALLQIDFVWITERNGMVRNVGERLCQQQQ